MNKPRDELCPSFEGPCSAKCYLWDSASAVLAESPIEKGANVNEHRPVSGINGTHIRIQASYDSPADYYNRKLESLSYNRTWRITQCGFGTIAFGVLAKYMTSDQRLSIFLFFIVL